MKVSMSLMKVLLIAAVLILGLSIPDREPSPPVVHAQISSPAYVCNYGPGGDNDGYPCAQYIVTIVPQRLGGGRFISQIQDQQVDVRTINAPVVANGSNSDDVSIQVLQPGSDTKTVTITVGNP